MSLGTAELARLSALLDLALDLPVADREAWLGRLQGEDARLGPTLRKLLAAPAAQETGDLIDRAPAFTTTPEDGSGSDFGESDAVGPYRLLRLLGQGGMGEVWLAERDDGQMKRRVALKLPLLSARRGVLAQRFARERDILGSLTHPHIARLYDAGVSDDGQPWLALEYVEGLPITRYCSDHGLGLRARVELLQQVLQAVQYAHANLVIHRDLKPGNVLVTADGQAMLLDFGIAKLLQDEHTDAQETELTRIGGRALTLHYAAPEQVAGTPVSIATDVWALGVLAYELLAGTRPFRGGQPREIEQAILADDPPPPAGVDADLATIVLKALKKPPADRYATVAAFADDLGRWLEGRPVLARRDSAWYRTRKFIGRHRLGVAVTAAVAVLLVATAAVALQQARNAIEQARIAKVEARTAEAVQGFLEGVFHANRSAQSDPVRARQRTAKELLDEGAARIDKTLDDVPEAKARVLETLSSMYSDMGQFGRAAELEEQRALLLARTLGDRHPRHVAALADWADSLASAGKQDRAAEIVARAEAMFAGGAAVDPLLRAKLDMMQVGLRQLKGGSADALPFAERSVRLLREQPPSRDLLTAMDGLAEMLRVQRRQAEARDLMLEALQIAPRTPGEGRDALSGLTLTLARAEDALGNDAAARAAFERALALADSHAGPTSNVAVERRIQAARFHVNGGRIGEALLLLQQARQAVEGWPVDAPERIAKWPEIVILEFGALVRQGRPEEALALAERSREVVDHAERNPFIAMAWHAYRAEALIDVGRFDEAAQGLATAHELIAAHRLSAVTLVRVQQMETQLHYRRRQPELAEKTLDALEAKPLPSKQTERWAKVMRSELAVARQRCEEAERQASAVLAEPRLRGDEKLHARLLLARGRAYACLGRHAESATALQTAVAAWDAIEDPAFGLRAAEARLAWAEALQRAGAPAAARAPAAQVAATLARHPQVDPALTADLRRLQARL